MDERRREDLKQGYTRVAGEYAARIYDELAGKPLDRALLDRLAARVSTLGPLCDVGCGPGHVARYLKERGADVTGIDLSPGMVEQARRLNPDIAFEQGDMLALPFENGALGGIAAFYSIIHIPREDLPAVLREFRRVLRPGGLALIAFHIGEQVFHLDEWWGSRVSLDFFWYRPEEMEAYAVAAGLHVDETVIREPYAPDVEHQSRRAYVFVSRGD